VVNRLRNVPTYCSLAVELVRLCVFSSANTEHNNVGIRTLLQIAGNQKEDNL